MTTPIPSPWVIAGIDLAGSPARPTGVCILTGDRARTQLAFEDTEILDLIRAAGPDLVTIDAPLSLPPGRGRSATATASTSGRATASCSGGGIRFFPITLGPMRMLTERGLRLKAQIEAEGFVPVECYPGGALDVWGLPRQQHDREGTAQGPGPAGSAGAAGRAERTRARRGGRGPRGTGPLHRDSGHDRGRGRHAAAARRVMPPAKLPRPEARHTLTREAGRYPKEDT